MTRRGLLLSGAAGLYATPRYFRVEKHKGTWWLVTPEGRRTVTTGVNHTEPGLLLAPYNRQATLDRYGADFVNANGKFNANGEGARRWARQVITDLKDWGFDALGYHTGLPPAAYRRTFPYIQAMRPVVVTPWARLERPDVFSPDFEKRVDDGVRPVCEECRTDPFLLGYAFNDRPDFLDGLGTPLHPWVAAIAQLGPEAPGKQRWLALLQRRGSNPSKPGAADSTAFLAQIADRYYQVHCDAVRRYDPNHLIFGDKLGCNGFVLKNLRPFQHTGVPDFLLPVLKRYVDVVLIEWYGTFAEQEAGLHKVYEGTGKPILLGDSSFSYIDPQHQVDAKGVLVGSLREAGLEYGKYLRAVLSLPYVIGWHFCGYIEGWRGMGNPWAEAQNGFKDPFERVHTETVELVRQANRSAAGWHQEAK